MNLKNSLIIFRNKKNNDFEDYVKLIKYFASENIYFCNLSYCAFDDSEEIVKILGACKDNYDNVMTVCPAAMENTVKDFVEKLFGAKFDGAGVLHGERTSVFVLRADGTGAFAAAKAAVEIYNARYSSGAGRAYLKTAGATVREINAALSEAKSLCEECEFNVTDSFSDGTVEIVYPKNLPKDVFDGVYRSLLKNLNDYVYAMENISLAERLFQLLKLRRMKISVAESFTGGGIAKRLVEVPGISEVYCEGLNTYSNQSKMRRLGVNELTLKQYGAVSEQTAFEMAEGLLKTGECDLAVSTTGIAGPKSDSTSKPVGLIYIGVGTAESISVYKYELKGSREQITETAINLALFLAFKKIK